MPIIKIPEKKNVWDSICEDFQQRNNQISTENDDVNEYDPAKYNSVFYGYAYNLSKVEDEKHLSTFDASISHPASYGYFIQPFTAKKEISKEKPKLDIKKLSEREYLEEYVFPVLLPALDSLLAEAKTYRCFERKRTAFNACDFMTEFLYRHNPNKSQNRKSIVFWDIPFVKEWLALYPRKPLAKSLIWTEEEACLKIQAYYRGHLIRRDPEVQELRKWQRELREENQNIVDRVDKFWNDNTDTFKLSSDKKLSSQPPELISSGANFSSSNNVSFPK